MSGTEDNHVDDNPHGDEASPGAGKPPPARLSRRRFLELTGAVGAAASLGPVLAACGGDDDSAEPAPAEPTPAEPAPAEPAEPAPAEPAAPTPAPAGATGRPVKIGYVSPQTGPLAPFGETDAWTVGKMQELFADGIDIGGTTHPLEIILKDTQSDPNRAAEEAADLILSDGVDMLIPGATPETTNPVGDTAEANGVPFLSTVAPWQPWFFRNPDITPDFAYEWNWHFFWGLEDIIAVFLDMWSQVDNNMVVGAIWPNDGDGNAWGDPELGFPPPLMEAGYTIVDPGRFPSGTDDFTAQISQFKAEGVEVVTGVPIPPDFTTFWTQSAQQDFQPPIVSVGKALLFPASVDALGELGNGMSTEVWWTPAFTFASSLTGQSSADLAEAWTSETGNQWTQPLGYAHAVFEVAADVLGRTADIDDPASIVEAIKATNLQTVAGTVSWGDGPVANVAKMKLAGGQWVPGDEFQYNLEIVSNSIFPEVPVAAPLQPIPYS